MLGNISVKEPSRRVSLLCLWKVAIRVQRSLVMAQV